MKAATPPVFCDFGDDVERQRRFTRGFRPVNLDHPAARQAADAERDVEAQRTGRYRVGLEHLALAELHDRAFAEGAVDLRQRRLQRPLPVALFPPANDPQNCLSHHRSLLISQRRPNPKPVAQATMCTFCSLAQGRA